MFGGTPRPTVGTVLFADGIPGFALALGLDHVVDQHLILMQCRAVALLSTVVDLDHLEDDHLFAVRVLQYLLGLGVEREAQRLFLVALVGHNHLRRVLFVLIFILFLIDQLSGVVVATVGERLVLVCVRVVDGQVAHQVALVPERLVALRTLVRLLLGLWRHVVRVVVEVLVPLQQLLLPERLVAELALELFGQEVHW